MKELSKCIASGFYSGFIPVAPGTFGTAVGSLVIIFLWRFDLLQTYYFLTLFTIITLIVGYASILSLPSDWAHDDQKIVIDEVLGLFVSMLFIPVNWQTLVASFILFRIFDIWKPLGIRKFDNSNSQFSVLADDIVAGIYANLSLRILVLLLPLT